MTYTVKEVYKTLQGEGFHTGRPAVLVRFAGCNLWSGREGDRHEALCSFCDTDFLGTDGPGGGRFATPSDLADAVGRAWDEGHNPLIGAINTRSARPYAVLTGGEPLLQVDADLVDALRAGGFEVGIETNGTMPAPTGLDWICVSPKSSAPIVQRAGDELKLIFPQPGADPDRYERLAFDHFFIQPMDGPSREKNTRLAIEFCRSNPRWRLSIQSHKYMGLP